MTDRISTIGAKYRDASGNNGRQYRRKPNVPTLSSTPTSSIAPSIGASAPPSGSQVWNGTRGALIANAMKKPRNSHFWVAPLGTWPINAENENVPVPEVTYTPITAANMRRPPTSEYRKNFIAAYWRRGPPKLPMMKYISTSIASKNT